ncbi:MAG: DeoR/GlpR transcriptional regulator [Chloroflexi bacterium]|nr:MAG: DeoR/GlpR transcriptional regulator [Chloroflexota bacterium]
MPGRSSTPPPSGGSAWRRPAWSRVPRRSSSAWGRPLSTSPDSCRRATTSASLLGTRSVRAVVLGGVVQREELACSGPIAAASVARYHADVAVIGAAGVSARSGITELEDDVAEINRQMMERSDAVMVIADGSKLGSVARAAVSPMTSVNTLVTDKSAKPAELEAVRALGIRVVLTGSEGG